MISTKNVLYMPYCIFVVNILLSKNLLVIYREVLTTKAYMVEILYANKFLVMFLILILHCWYSKFYYKYNSTKKLLKKTLPLLMDLLTL